MRNNKNKKRHRSSPTKEGARAALFRRGTHHCHAGRRCRGEAGMRQRASPQRQPQQNKSGCPVLPLLFLSLNNHHTNAAQVTVTAGRDGACQRSQYTTLIHPAHTHTHARGRDAFIRWLGPAKAASDAASLLRPAGPRWARREAAAANSCAGRCWACHQPWV